MKLTTWILAGLMLAAGTAEGLAYPAVDALESALRQRMEAMDAEGDLDKTDRKRRKALFKSLKRMGKPRGDLRDDVDLLEDVTRKLAKRFRDDGQVVVEDVHAATVATLDDIEIVLDGLAWQLEESSSIAGSRRERAQYYLGQAYTSAGQVRSLVENDETHWVGHDRKAMSVPAAVDWSTLRAAQKRMRKALRRVPKLRKWLGDPPCPGRPIAAGEFAAIEYARCQGSLVIAHTADADRVDATLTDGELRLIIAVCRPGEPAMTVELRVQGGPIFPAGWERVHDADGSPTATARATVTLGLFSHADLQRHATGTVTIDSIDPQTRRIVGSYEVWVEFEGGDLSCPAEISGSFSLNF